MVNLSHTTQGLVTRKGSVSGSEEARQVPSPECPFWPPGWGTSGRSAPEHHLLCRGNEFGSQVDLMALHSTQLRLSLSLPQASHLLTWVCSAAGPWLCRALLRPLLTPQIHLCSGIKGPMYEQNTCQSTSSILLSAGKLVTY